MQLGEIPRPHSGKTIEADLALKLAAINDEYFGNPKKICKYYFLKINKKKVPPDGKLGNQTPLRLQGTRDDVKKKIENKKNKDVS